MANNWRDYGSVFGHNEIVKLMVHRDLVILGLTDGVMCAGTIFGLFLQLIIHRGWISWNKHGWIVQNVDIPCIFHLLSRLILIVVGMAKFISGIHYMVGKISRLALDTQCLHYPSLPRNVNETALLFVL